MCSRRHVDVSRGETQCPFVKPHDDDGFLCCALKVGHAGKHEDTYGYTRGEWFVRVEQD